MLLPKDGGLPPKHVAEVIVLLLYVYTSYVQIVGFIRKMAALFFLLTKEIQQRQQIKLYLLIVIKPAT